MSFRDRAKPANPSKIVLPITPMLDLTFQLLFFFIINFRSAPALLEGQLDLTLPSQNRAANQADPVGLPGQEEPVLEPELTVKVRTQLDGVNDGDISALAIGNSLGRETPVEGGLVGLTDELKKRRETLTQKSHIKVQSDRKLKVKSLMKVMDACRNAGFDNVGIVPPEDFGR